jgi:hypothetical protein
MHKQPKPKKVGRPKMAKGEAKGKIVPIRFNAEDIKKVAAAAKANKRTVSEWIRNTISAGIRDKNMEKLEDYIKVLRGITGEPYSHGFYKASNGESGYKAAYRDGNDWYEYHVRHATAVVSPSKVADALARGEDPTHYGLLKFTESETQ